MLTGEKKYSDEAEQHKSTQRELDDEREKHQILMQEFESFKHEQTLTNEASRKLIQELQDYQKAIRIKRAERKGLIVTSLLFGIPYIIILSITDIFKSRFSDFSLLSIVSVCVLVLVPILAFLFYKKVQHYFVRLFQKQIGK